MNDNQVNNIVNKLFEISSENGFDSFYIVLKGDSKELKVQSKDGFLSTVENTLHDGWLKTYIRSKEY